MIAWCQAKPRRKLSTAPELAARPDRSGHGRGSDGPDAGNGLQELSLAAEASLNTNRDLVPAEAIVQIDQLSAEDPQDVLGELGQPGLFALDDPFRKIDGPRDAPSDGDAEFRGQAPEHVDQLGALSNHEISCAVQREKRLLFLGFDLDEAHRGPCHGFADRFGVDRIGLAALHVGFDVHRRHQPDGMAEHRELPRPMVARCAGLNADEAGRQSLEERQHLRPSQRSVEGNLSGLGYSVDLKDVLGQVEADSGNLHGVAPLDRRF